MKRLAHPLIALTVAWFSACGSSSSNTPGSERNRQEYGEAGVAAAIAVTATLIQTARNQAQPLQRPDECCAICNPCAFPCGDICVPIGSICASPSGCACFDSQLPPEHRPQMSQTSCPASNQAQGEDAVVLPLIVVP